MSTAENKLLVGRYIEEVANTGNVDDLAGFISPDYIDSHDKTGQANGIEGAKRHILGVRQTYPDLQVTIEQQIAEGDWVASRIWEDGGNHWRQPRPSSGRAHRGTWGSRQSSWTTAGDWSDSGGSRWVVAQPTVRAAEATL